MEEPQVPRGPKNMKCPWWQKPMSQVCHTCPMWVSVRGYNVNTGEEMDQWSCAFRFMPNLTIEVARTNRESAASSNGVRNILTSMVVNRVNKEHLAKLNGAPQVGKPAITRD